MYVRYVPHPWFGNSSYMISKPPRARFGNLIASSVQLQVIIYFLSRFAVFINPIRLWPGHHSRGLITLSLFTWTAFKHRMSKSDSRLPSHWIKPYPIVTGCPRRQPLVKAWIQIQFKFNSNILEFEFCNLNSIQIQFK